MMKILLLSMPDAVPLFYAYKSQIPNLGIRSIAANLDMQGVEARYMDLVFSPKNISGIIKEAILDFKPGLVGISAMTFQYNTALKIMKIIKSIDAKVKIALGGYHATLLYDQIPPAEDLPFDYMIRNEGEKSFKELVKALMGQSRDLSGIKGLSFRKNGGFVHNEKEELIDLAQIKLPQRNAHLFGFKGQAFGRVEAVETSRGCTHECIFCSIANMYGRNFRKYSVERVINDIKIAKESGAKRIFFVDDNITLDTKHFEKICEGIVEAGLNDLLFGAQLASKGIARSESLARKMRDANFALVFLGIENISRGRLENLGKGDIFNDSITAINYLHKYDIGIMGGFILGNPDDKLDDIKACFRFARKSKVDLLMTQYLTP
ncbi:MAG: radical SAM protein, partial [Candidatus Omnitrophica bacterium]|nr:radical SAM protein [Candidatus Omnitrophota bacterium]